MADKEKLPDHADEVAWIIRNNNIKIFAEIGVNKGHSTKSIIRSTGCNLREYWAIDQWSVFTDADKYGRMARIDQAGWDDRYYKVFFLQFYFPCLKVVKGDSIKTAKMFPDYYFDFVYIDTSHQYEETKEDIFAWYPKVKIGGFIGGHDYITPRQDHQGVKKAVDEIFGDNKRIRTKGDGVWLVTV